MDENAKKKALLMIPYGLFVLGARAGDKQTVATVNWLTQASFKPPLVVVGIKADSTAHALVKESKIFTLSMLGAGQKSIGTAFFKHRAQGQQVRQLRLRGGKERRTDHQRGAGRGRMQGGRLPRAWRS
jgi:flavin reductase (DIM6/NTAB) family NADH-FMN oxidoreductase RutF